ncbi:hypothetical protein EDD11_002896 [Mortierella claussenii]|nr:hypothetical protein EDD11_002896 [Mortierella claussenii]
MELMKENQQPAAALGVEWDNNKNNNSNNNNSSSSVDGLDLLLQAAQKTVPQPKALEQKKTRTPPMVLTGSYDTPVVVGRGSQATLNLGRINKQVSRRHAIIQWCGELSTFQIIVLGQNGVRINGTGYPSGQQAVLKAGDVVDLVGVKMRFRAPAAPPPPYLADDYQDTELLQEVDEQDQMDDDFEIVTMPAGLVTPKRKSTIHQTHALATPTHSSPIRESPQLTPTARMRHKIDKYDMSSTRRILFHSPPPSSDAATEFGSSPTRPVFMLGMDTSPVKRFSTGLESPQSEAYNIFEDDLLMPKIPSKPMPMRTPLAPLSLHQENGQSGVHTDSTNNISSACMPMAGVLGTQSNQTKVSKPEESTKTLVAASSAKETQSATDITKGAEKKSSVAAAPKQEKPETAKDLQTPSKQEIHGVTKPKSKSSNTHSPTKEAVRPKKSTEIKKKISQTQPQLQTTNQKSSTSAIPLVTAAEKPVIKRPLSSNQSISKKEKEVAEDISPSRESSPEVPTTKSPMDYTEMIIDTLVFARKKKSMTLSELFEEMVASQPSLMVSQSQDEIKEQMLQCLSAARCVGKITRKGKDAYNKPLENQWYYIPECDHNVMRKLTRQEVMPSARKCTLKDKQYFFKMPPKLPYHRKSTSPYAVKPSSVRRSKEASKLGSGGGLDDNEAGDASSSSSDADEDANEHAQVIRKRKSGVSGHVGKKRKSTVAALTTTVAAHNEEVEEEDDDDDVHNDSLDDLSELSGLSD